MNLKYDENSWHYRFWDMTTNKSYVANWFSQWQYSYDTIERKVPATDFCSYWRAMFLYVVFQIPVLFAFWFVLAWGLVFSPISALLTIITHGVWVVNEGTTIVGLAVLFFAGMALAISLFITVLAKIFSSDWWERMSDYLNQKCCPPIEFIE